MSGHTSGSVPILRSTGMYVPEHEVGNDVLRARFAASAPEFVDKMEATTGITRRFHAPSDWATSDLAVRAARHALARAGVSPEDVDLIVVGTDSPDYVTPSTSVVVQHKLGAKKAGTFDVGCACASFPTALSSAAGMMTTNPWMQNVLVVGAYMMHKLADPNDTSFFFYGDGAGAALLQRGEARGARSAERDESSSRGCRGAEPPDRERTGILGATFRADGAFAKHWGIYSGGTAEPASEESVRAGRTQVRIVEKYPPEVNDVGWPAIVQKLAEQERFALDEIDLVIFTQVRRRTIEKAMTALGLPMEKTHMIMGQWGYTGSACIPMALHDAIDSGRVRPGDLVVLVGSGVGHNQAGIALRISKELVRHHG